MFMKNKKSFMSLFTLVYAQVCMNYMVPTLAITEIQYGMTLATSGLGFALIALFAVIGAPAWGSKCPNTNKKDLELSKIEAKKALAEANEKGNKDAIAEETQKIADAEAGKGLGWDMRYICQFGLFVQTIAIYLIGPGIPLPASLPIMLGGFALLGVGVAAV